MDIQLPKGYEDATPIVPDHREEEPSQTWNLTEVGNAERFAWRYGGRFVHTDATGWLVYDWTLGLWGKDTDGQVDRAMLSTIRLIPLEANLIEGEGEDKEEMRMAYHNWARKCESNAVINNSLSRAKKLAEFARDFAAFDNKPHLFNCANGTYNFNTLSIQPHDPNDLLTKGSNIKYDPNATCPQFEQFLSDVMAGNQEMIDYLRRSTGYTISANTSEQCLFIPWGCGGTGKSTFLHILDATMGSYCATPDSEMFMAKGGDSGQPFDMAGLQGTRALFAAETEENKRLAVAKVKRMTGQDKIVACFKHKDSYTFTPQWKIWLATNDRPKVPADDDAAWDRIKPIPFEVRFRGTDRQVKDLDKKLVAEEGSGILNWAFKGYAEWKQYGLMQPDIVTNSADEWRETEDWFQRFLDERVATTTSVSEYVSKVDLWNAFSRWGEDNKEAKYVTQRTFGEMMRKKGYEADSFKVNGKSVKAWKGVKLLDLLHRFSEHMPAGVDYDSIM
jgi:putative DNA primase/helicase